MAAKKERFWFQQPSHAIAVAAVLGGGYLLLPGGAVVKTGEAHPIVKLIHLGALSVNVGTQFWSTFAVGLTLIRHLPRHMFGHVQGKLFPKYFRTTSILSLITLGTYLYTHPTSSWGTRELVQVIALGGCLFGNFVNYCLLDPTLELMNKMYTIEKEYGIGEFATKPDLTEVRQDEQWCKSRRKFMVIHGVSSLCNLVSMACNALHLYHLAINTTM